MPGRCGTGPCANAVKDAQRTKTHEGTTRTLSIVWGTQSQRERTERAYAWYRDLMDRARRRHRGGTVGRRAAG